MKGVQCYELFGGIALKKSRIFIFFPITIAFITKANFLFVHYFIIIVIIKNALIINKY